MSLKLDYITRLFQKTSTKAIEHYVLTRLWHRLDDYEIEMLPQQYVNRHADKYALTDVYFPQVKLHVEVNEQAHYDSAERIQADALRRVEIESRTGHELVVIDCRDELDLIHFQIDDVVKKIKSMVGEQRRRNKFEAWDPAQKRDPEYWKDRRVISVTDNISLPNIEAICELFNADFRKTKRGFLRRGAISHPRHSNVLIWWPSEHTRQGWRNTLIEDETAIIETHENAERRYQQFRDYYGAPQTRYTFFQYKDVLGFTSYRFKGVFEFDSSRSNSETGITWKRVSDRISLDPDKSIE